MSRQRTLRAASGLSTGSVDARIGAAGLPAARSTGRTFGVAVDAIFIVLVAEHLRQQVLTFLLDLLGALLLVTGRHPRRRSVVVVVVVVVLVLVVVVVVPLVLLVVTGFLLAAHD